jgi:hypothetical protein
MNEDTDQLSATFAAHEHLAPDAGVVLAKANRIARSYRRRRWAVRATGASVVGAGLVAGGIALPGRVGGAASTEAVSSSQFASGGDPTPTPTPTYTQDQEFNAYFAAGYDYDNAVELAQLWNDTSNIGAVKADAGLKLLEGQTLPVQPDGPVESQADQARAAFFAAGYDYNDAVTLGNLWHETDITQVKADAGQKLLDGQTLPIQPSGPTVVNTTSGTQADRARTAFFAAGYTYDDAVTLGNLWHESDTFQVKADAGQKLLDGGKLPIAP